MKKFFADLRQEVRRPRPSGGEPCPTGGFDRVHDGLVSGWLVCPACNTPPSLLPALLLDGQRVAATATQRGDVPGGIGFLVRFSPTGSTPPRIRVQCPAHRDNGLEITADPVGWQVPVLGAIESISWPIVTGWLAIFGLGAAPVELEVDGRGAVAIRGTVARPDVQSYLGVEGVAGFQIDLGAELAFAVPDDIPIRLFGGRALLADGVMRGSPIGAEYTGCLPPPGGTALSPTDVVVLSRRFTETEIDIHTNDWRALVTRLGQVTLTDESHQWADFMAHSGCTPQQVAAASILRDIRSLGVTALNPLPASLNTVPRDRERLLTPLSPTANPATRDHPKVALHGSALVWSSSAPIETKVAVAGLVGHKSGLGHSASNSLRILDAAGIHACAAPLFPAPGGWNARLGATREAALALRDHTVLLHMTIDRVIPTLTGQPALMATDRLIGYFFWETETVPQRFHRVLNLMDEIWCATEFVAGAFRAVTNTPVNVTRQVVDVSNAQPVYRRDLGIQDEAFVVHCSFDANSTVVRKNPNGAIDAFKHAFGADPSAVLLLKIRNMAQVAGLARSGDEHALGLLQRLVEHPDIRVITEEGPYGYALGLIQLADCYLSLHRSEGFGYGVAEAMALGTPVVTTAYSGTMDLTDDRTAWLVPYSTRGILPGEYFFWEPDMVWADPDISAAAEALQRIRGGDQVQSRVNAARARVDHFASSAALSERYRCILQDGDIDSLTGDTQWISEEMMG